MRSLIALTLIVSAIASHAADLEYDPQLDARQQAMTGLYVRTRHCLGDAARAIMREGVRDSKSVEFFMVTMCGDTFYSFLRRDGMGEDQARRTLVELTELALYEDVLHQPIPKK